MADRCMPALYLIAWRSGMAEVKQLQCPTCGANVTIPQDVARGTCAYCGNAFAVEMNQGEAVLHSSEQITGAIKAGTEQTLTELKNMELGQQRAELVQQHTAVRMHLDSIESELRTLQRSSQTRLIRSQTKDLNARRQEILLELVALQAEIHKIDVILHPELAQATISSAPTKRSRPGRARGCLWI